MKDRRAAFLDRDGTIIEDVGYLRDSAEVCLLPRAGEAIARLKKNNFVVVLVTNQSGIARGHLTTDEYRTTESRLDALLAEQGASLDAQYFCPHLPELTGPCECRKPGTLLYRQAAERFGIDLSRSWWIGDRLRDVLPAKTLGGQGILLGTVEPDDAEGARFRRARDLAAAVDLILEDIESRDPSLRSG